MTDTTTTAATSTEQAPRTALRLLDTTSARLLADMAATLEDLQTVLRCCELLVTELAASEARSDVTGIAGADGVDGVVMEALWTTAVLSYSRCFTATGTGTALTVEDVVAAQPHGEVTEWHQVLLRLRDHYADPALNPRERFTIGIAQDKVGAAEGIGITSARQPLVDLLTVRQTGAIAFALSTVLDGRLIEQQRAVFEEIRGRSRISLDKLPRLDAITGQG